VNPTLVRQRALALLPRRSDWARRGWRADLQAGVTVAVVALPLALAFGVASGMGARAGLVTAIIAGAVAAVFGGSNVQVSGPTGAMTVVLIPVVHRFGTQGVLLVGLLAGVLLVAMAAGGLGKFIKFLPAPVVEGFTAGIAAVIALQQVPAALGITDAHGSTVWRSAADAIVHFAARPHWTAAGLAVGVAAVMLIGGRWRPAWPFSLIAVAAATTLAALTGADVTTIGPLPAGLPTPSVSFIDPGAITALLPAAAAVATLAALESLLSATVADAMSVGQQHHPDRELFGQGLANLTVPLFGGMPATAAIARTAVNVRSGATTRLAALTHAVALTAIVLAAAPLVGRIPLAALAGVLLATAVRMVEASALLAMARTTRRDGLVLVATFVTTIALDLVTAVAVGVGIAVILALRAVARSARIDQVPLEAGDHSVEEQRLIQEHIVAYRIDGPLFFAAAYRFLIELTDVADVRVIILRMSRVTTIDATGAQVLREAITRLQHRGITVLISGISAPHEQVLAALGVADQLRHDGLVFDDTPSAINHARTLLPDRR